MFVVLQYTVTASSAQTSAVHLLNSRDTNADAMKWLVIWRGALSFSTDDRSQNLHKSIADQADKQSKWRKPRFNVGLLRFLADYDITLNEENHAHPEIVRWWSH